MKRFLAAALVCLAMGSRPVCAREFDAETGLIHMGFRDYDPETGRFLQEDPIDFAGGDVNLYVYVHNNPVRYVDPLGLYSEDPYAFFYDIDNFAQDTSNFSAGLGDALLFGFGDDLRGATGIGGVNRCSKAYRSGGWASFAIGAGRLGYAATAKAGAAMASSGQAASLFRFQLRNAFRLGMASNWRNPNLAKYTTDAALRAAAGRTNPYMNAYAAGVSAAGASGGMCGCP